MSHEAQTITEDGAARAMGRHADHPGQIPWRGWKRVIRRAALEMISDRVSLNAAGCAFYATLALFPAISMVIFIYGLAFDPTTVEPQLVVLAQVLPAEGYALIAQRVHTLVGQRHDALTAGLVISTSIALWSSSAGTKSILSALNVAYEEKERRSVVRFQLTAIGMTMCAIFGASVALTLLILLPAAIWFFGLSAYARVLLKMGGTVLMLLFVLVSLSLLYRYGPCRRSARWAWILPGAVLATLLWAIASAMLSFYISRLSSYDVTYGPLGAIVGVMTWFWVTVYVALLGAELNAELEQQTTRDTTAGRPQPIGLRGAYVADHVAED